MLTDCSPFVAAILTISFRETKTLLTRGKQGEEILFRFVTCLPPDYPNWLRGFARHTTWLAQG